MVDENVWLKEGHIAWIDKPREKFYRIVRREPFDFETGEEDTAIFSTVASGSSSDFKNIALLEPDNDPDHLMQVLWGVAHTGNIKYYMKIPQGVNVFGVDLDKEVGYINADKSPWYDPNPVFQFYLIHQWYPSINCVNNSPVIITPKVWFRGMKYDIKALAATDPTLQAVKDGRRPHRRIILGGIQPTPG